MAAFCDNNRQYLAFFDTQEALDANKTTFNHIDWPPVPGGKPFQLSFESVPLKSYNFSRNHPTCHKHLA
jgi:hypothetical protein